MHEALRLEALSRLPVQFEVAARAVCACENPGKLSSLAQRFLSPTQDGNIVQLLSPAYYHLLQPSRVPTPEQLTVMSELTEAYILGAHVGIMGFYAEQAPSGTEVDVWKRVCIWISFMYAFHRTLPASLRLSDECNLLVDFLEYTFSITDRNKQRRDIFLAQPGFLRLLTHAWKLILDIEDRTKRRVALLYMHLFVPESFTDLDRDAIVEGAGGTLDDLASLLVRNISICNVGLSEPRPLSMPNDLEGHLTFTLSVISRLHRMEDPPPPSQAPPTLSTIYIALRPRKVISALTVALCLIAKPHNVAATRVEFPQEPVMSILVALSQMLSVYGKIAMGSAYRIIFVEEILGSLLIYANVLRSLSGSVIDVDDAELVPQMLHPAVREHLKDMARSYRYRNAVEEVGLITQLRRACDNVQRHRTFDSCNSSPASNSPPDLRILISPGEVSFLRAVVHRLYQAKRPTMFYMSAHVASRDWRLLSVTVFDFASANTQMKFIPEEGLRDAIESYDPLWDDKVARAQRSGGRMKLHVAHCRINGSHHWIVLPLRMNNSFFSDATRHLMHYIPGALEKDNNKSAEFKFAHEFSQLSTPARMYLWISIANTYILIPIGILYT
ncbi:hypothetical protein C8F01DRAFT_1229675 [Mycena amicta]|nr:hypothetical protein C8F01DRAFT_1229675 [Mycena amicta]